MEEKMMVKPTDDVIIKTIARILSPFILLYALYVIMHGHHSPGGGFQGGVILGAAYILLSLTYGVEDTWTRFSKRQNTILASIGLLLYSGIGALCLSLGGNFLDYGQLHHLLPVAVARARSLGILGVELGVGLGVMAVMFSIFTDIATGGEE